jgi:hypothetical protein
MTTRAQRSQGRGAMTMTSDMQSAQSATTNDLTRAKLEAFERIEADVLTSFTFVQDMHGQRRFTSLELGDILRYLHALYICECKDRLLSIPVGNSRYEGQRCLELMRDWQHGESAGVVAFIHRKLDQQPFAELTRQIEEASHANDLPRVHRLTSGRNVLLSRNNNLCVALDTLFTVPVEQMGETVAALCASAGHSPAEIERQLADLHSALYSYAPHALLARRNMHVMNQLGQHITSRAGDHPGERTDRVLAPAPPVPSYAEERISGEMTQFTLHWNAAPRLQRSPSSASGADIAIRPETQQPELTAGEPHLDWTPGV